MVLSEFCIDFYERRAPFLSWLRGVVGCLFLYTKHSGEKMLKKVFSQTVKEKLLVIIGFAFLLLVGGLVASASMEKKKTFLQGEQLQLQSKYGQVQKVFQDSATEALSMAFVVAEMPDVQAAVCGTR